MKIKKVYNNNVILVEKENQTEMVVMGRGLAFQKKAGDEVDLSKVEKTFVLNTKGLSERLADLISEIPVEHLKLADDIIQSVHAAHFTIPFSSYIILGEDFNCDADYEVEGYIEDIYIKQVGKRKLFKNVMILLHVATTK